MNKPVQKKRSAPPFSCPKILAFHKVTPSVSFGVTNFSPGRFIRLHGFLKEAGYRLCSLHDAVRGRDSRGVAITFDDGYRHLSDLLIELLQHHQVAPTVFVPTHFIGKTNTWDYSHFFKSTLHMARSRIKELASLGVQFGSHGHRHTDLTRLTPEALETDLRHSKDLLEDIIGREVSDLSYPFGRRNRRVAEAASSAGYKLGLTMKFPTGEDHPMAVGRLPIYCYDTHISITRKLTGGPLAGIEKLKAGLTGSLAAGTGLLNRLRRYDSP